MTTVRRGADGGGGRHLVVCAPMRMEARALRRGSDDLTVLCTGTGPAKAARAGASLARGGTEPDDQRGVVVAGIGGGLAPGLRAGDVVVATEVRAADGSGPPVRPAGADLLAELMRGHGLTVHTGPVVSARAVAHGVARTRLATTGASIVDTESYWLLTNLSKLTNLASGPAWCVRVVADAAPGRVLTPLTLRAIRTAFDRLPAVGAALAEWAVTDRESRESRVREVRADGGAAAAGR